MPAKSTSRAFRLSLRDAMLAITIAGILFAWWHDRQAYTGMSAIGGAGRRSARRVVTGNLLVTFVLDNSQRQTGQRIKDVAMIEFYSDVVIITRHNGEGRMLRLAQVKDFVWRAQQ